MKQSGHTQDTPTIPELIRYYERKLTGTTMPGAVRMYQATLDYLKSIQISMDSLATERYFESEQEYINYLIRVIQNLQFANINRGRLIDRLEKEKPE